MEGNKQFPQEELFVKVISDEQMEILRKQIAAYAAICEQLVELHRNLSHNYHDKHLHLAGIGNTYISTRNLTAASTSSGQKLSRRQRWNPTSEQLHILECVFDQQGIKTPNPLKVKEITAELAHHGQISEPNVYNWFQNRRARLKRKQILLDEANISNAESFDSKVTKPQNLQQSDENFVSERKNENFCGPENALVRTGNILPMRSFQGCPKPLRNFPEMAIHNSLLNAENEKN